MSNRRRRTKTMPEVPLPDGYDPPSAAPVAAQTELLTDAEHGLIVRIGECACAFASIINDGAMLGYDSREFSDKIHQLQHMVMSQAAARAYPDRYRLLGETPVRREDTT